MSERMPDLSARVGPLPENWQEELAAELAALTATTKRLNRLASRLVAWQVREEEAQ